MTSHAPITDSAESEKEQQNNIEIHLVDPTPNTPERRKTRTRRPTPNKPRPSSPQEGEDVSDKERPRDITEKTVQKNQKDVPKDTPKLNQCQECEYVIECNQDDHFRCTEHTQNTVMPVQADPSTQLPGEPCRDSEVDTEGSNHNQNTVMPVQEDLSTQLPGEPC
jgi:hypothetical protein